MSATNSQMTYEADVIIIGAGPIGLTTANALRHHGVDVLLIEERTESKPNSRANNIWSRPQELLASVNLLDAFRGKAHLIDHVNVFIDQKPLERVETAKVNSPYPHVLYSGQDIIETTLAEELAKKGGRLQRGIKVTSVDQDGDGVVVSYQDASDTNAPVKTMRCKYLVGADGNKSTVRKSIGLDFETEKFEKRANRQIDAKLSWRRSTNLNQLWFFTYHNGLAGVMPVWEGYHRLFFLEDTDLMPEREPTLEEIQTRAREVTGDDTLQLTDPIWTSYSQFKHGVAKAYAKERVFLAGDAGHFTLPMGGQGMNAGFHDAVGLAWRLAMQLNGLINPVVLESYSEERQQEHAQLDKKQTTAFRRLVYRNKLEDSLLDIVREVMPNIGSELLATDDLQQLSVGYPNSKLAEDHLFSISALKKAKPKVGYRAPDAPVINARQQEVTIFSIIYQQARFSWDWSLLLFDGRRHAWENTSDISALIGKWPFIHLSLIVARQPSAPVKPALQDNTYFDFDGVAHAAYGLDGIPAMLLVRPDGHIAFRAQADQPHLLLAYCNKLFR